MKKQRFNKMFSADCQYSSFSYAGSFSPASATTKEKEQFARVALFFSLYHQIVGFK